MKRLIFCLLIAPLSLFSDTITKEDIVKAINSAVSSNTNQNNPGTQSLSSTDSDLQPIFSLQQQLVPFLTPLDIINNSILLPKQTPETPDLIKKTQSNKNQFYQIYQKISSFRQKIQSCKAKPNQDEKTLSDSCQNNLNRERTALCGSQNQLKELKNLCDKKGILHKKLTKPDQVSTLDVQLSNLALVAAGKATEQTIKKNRDIKAPKISDAMQFPLPKMTLMSMPKSETNDNELTIINAGDEYKLTLSKDRFKSKNKNIKLSLTKDKAQSIKNYRTSTLDAINVRNEQYANALAMYLLKSIILHKVTKDIEQLSEKGPDQQLITKRMSDSWQQKIANESNTAEAMKQSIALLSELRYEQLRSYQNNEQQLIIAALNQVDANQELLARINQSAGTLEQKHSNQAAGQNT
ncbi:MAG: hypothetical protein ACON5A_00410 [Candidatus Comchoanobacterales bacterium]